VLSIRFESTIVNAVEALLLQNLIGTLQICLSSPKPNWYSTNLPIMVVMCWKGSPGAAVKLLPYDLSHGLSPGSAGTTCNPCPWTIKGQRRLPPLGLDTSATHNSHFIGKSNRHRGRRVLHSGGPNLSNFLCVLAFRHLAYTHIHASTAAPLIPNSEKLKTPVSELWVCPTRYTPLRYS
jgi:hypothetical protein